jgi:hypothetical protein
MNCSYIFENTCYDKSIDYGNYIVGGLLLFGFFAIPIYCLSRYYEINKQNKQNNDRIILIPGYVHTDPTNIDSPPAYKDNINPERIV